MMMMMLMMTMETMETCKAHVFHNECSKCTMKKFTKLSTATRKNKDWGILQSINAHVTLHAYKTWSWHTQSWLGTHFCILLITLENVQNSCILFFSLTRHRGHLHQQTGFKSIVAFTPDSFDKVNYVICMPMWRNKIKMAAFRHVLFLMQWLKHRRRKRQERVKRMLWHSDQRRKCFVMQVHRKMFCFSLFYFSMACFRHCKTWQTF
jgi:hypothetical protein